MSTAWDSFISGLMGGGRFYHMQSSAWLGAAARPKSLDVVTEVPSFIQLCWHLSCIHLQRGVQELGSLQTCRKAFKESWGWSYIMSTAPNRQTDGGHLAPATLISASGTRHSLLGPCRFESCPNPADSWHWQRPTRENSKQRPLRTLSQGWQRCWASLGGQRPLSAGAEPSR